MRGVLAQLGPHLEAEIAAFVHDSGVPGASAAALVRGEPPWTFAYGVADVRSRTALEPSSALRVGSLTKPFTAASILLLRDRRALGLDDPVTAHMPEFATVVPAAGTRVDDVRIRHLVTHRAGLPGEIHALDEAADAYPTIDGILDGLGDVALRTPPGTGMRYSNLGYQLLGEIVARAAGQSYESFCEEALFLPHGLTCTAFVQPAGSAAGHRARAFTDHVTTAGDRRKRTNADGGLWSSARDQAAWLAAHLQEGSPFSEMTGPIEGSERDGEPGQGLGWFRERRDARTLVYHQGSTPGFAARLAFSPTLGGGAVVLANGEAATVGVLGRVVDLVLDAVEGAPPSEAPPPVPPAPTPEPYPAAWEDLVGFYAWPGSAMLFRLEVRAGSLRLVDLHAGDRPTRLDAVGDGGFVGADGGWAGEPVRIRRDAGGRVIGLRIGAWTVARLIEATATSR